MRRTRILPLAAIAILAACSSSGYFVHPAPGISTNVATGIGGGLRGRHRIEVTLSDALKISPRR